MKALPSIVRGNLMKTSKAYRAAMLVMFICYFVLVWMTMHSLVDVAQQNLDDLVLRAFIEAGLLVLVCHFLVRPYLRANLMDASVKVKEATLAIGYLALVSIVMFLASYAVGNLPFLESTNVSQIQILNPEGIIESHVSQRSIFILGSIQSFVILSLWSITYLVWKYYINKKQLHSEAQENRLSRLTSQLQPHFLFNTLNSIRALVFIDQDKAADMITSLSELLRNQMYFQSSTETTFAMDWETAQRYLQIESVRFEGRLSTSVDNDPAGMAQKLPPLTVLTLIENAIKHGVSGSDEPVAIHVDSGLSGDDRWYLRVQNSVGGQPSISGSRVGLHNVRKRLELMFGSNIVFDAGRSNQHFTVFMELPHVQSAYR